MFINYIKRIGSLWVIYWDVVSDLSFPGDVPSISLVRDGQWVIVVLPERWISCNSQQFSVVPGIWHRSEVKNLWGFQSETTAWQDTKRPQITENGGYISFRSYAGLEKTSEFGNLIWYYFGEILCFEYCMSGNYDIISHASQSELVKRIPAVVLYFQSIL